MSHFWTIIAAFFALGIGLMLAFVTAQHIARSDDCASQGGAMFSGTCYEISRVIPVDGL